MDRIDAARVFQTVSDVAAMLLVVEHEPRIACLSSQF